MIFSPTRQRLWSILLADIDTPLAGELTVVHAAKVIRQTFVRAAQEPTVDLSLGLLAVEETDHESMRFAIGFDEILAAGTEASRTFEPNGWVGRADDHNRPPLGPRLTAMGLELSTDLVEPTMRWDLASITLSKAPPAGAGVEPTSPVPVAMLTAFELGVEVFLAAGNSGPQDGTLNGWAAQSAIVVGGTTDEVGTQVDPRSSRGIPGGPGPSLVTWAASAVDHSELGTSYATPRAARLHGIATTIANAILAVAARRAGVRKGTPITTVGVVDWGEPITPGTLAQMLSRNPTAGVSEDAIAALLLALNDRGARLELDCSRARRAEVVRQWVLDACRPVDAPNHVAGAGFLDEVGFRSRMAGITGADVGGLFAPDVELKSLADEPTLRSLTIAGPDMLHAIDIYSQTGGLAYYDHDKRSLTVW